MAKSLKNHVSRRILELLVNSGPSQNDINRLASKLVLKKSSDSQVGLCLPLMSFGESVGLTNTSEYAKLQDRFLADDVINSVSIADRQGKPSISFHLNQETFIKEVIENHVAEQRIPANSKRVIIEFSSPNIAKPFHVGHLRSTIIGNFIANLHEWFGYDVMRLNYLGDWGPQFGLVKIGMQLLNPSQEELSQKPLNTLYQAYVCANKAAEKNPEVFEEARNIFLNLERGQNNDLADWKLYKEYTITELIKTYSRLGIKFDTYAWESDYKANAINNILQLLKSSEQFGLDEDGRHIFRVDSKPVPLLKSDGTTLYLTRDVAAAVDRKEKLSFDKMYYLADTSQHNHFRNLFHILKSLQFSWSENLTHVRFGRVRGMSTRRGEAVFLNDILDEAQHLMIRQQEDSPNTKVNFLEDQKTADILGVSTIIVADLVHKRMKDYTFNWDSARSMAGNTGVRLQYTHCRLKSLQEKCLKSPAPAIDPLLLYEPAALNLIFEISRFEEVLERSFEELEASKLADYLFTLCDAINKAILALRVLNAGKVGEQRLILFEEARAVLHCGMKLMGLTPLSRM